MLVRFRRVDWQYRTPFRIAYSTKTHEQTILVELDDAGICARGEGLGLPYHGETVESMLDQVSSIASDLRNGISRSDLQHKLPAGGARNALDCALWDLEAKRSGARAWEMAGLSAVQPVETDFTLGIDTPEATARAAAAARAYPLLKIKLTGEGDLERIRAIRQARPDVALIVDANQSWSEQQLYELTPQLATLGVKLIEQPLAVGRDDVLAQFTTAVPLCADESCQTTQSLPALRRKYAYINIKLDKSGGLTEALRLARAGWEMGFKLMVGCMGGTSLSMAPAFIIAQLCEFVDLDGPLFLLSDVESPMSYEGCRLSVPARSLWG